jgi:hypothetical protein
MEEQNTTQSNESVQSSKNIWIIVISVITTALIVGGVTYWWQNQQLQKYATEIESIKAELQNKEASEAILLEEIEQLEKQVSLSGTENKESTTQTTSDVSGSQYTNVTYNFSFTIPSGWVFQREEENIGGDPLRVYLTVPGFKEEVPPKSEYILSISVTERTFDEGYQYMDWNVGKESEEKITVAGREAVKRIGRHEFGGYLTVVILPNADNTIELILRTNEEPYASQFETLLDSFEFTE